MTKEKRKLKQRYEAVTSQINSRGLDSDVLESMRSYVENQLVTGKALDGSDPFLMLLKEEAGLKQRLAVLEQREGQCSAAASHRTVKAGVSRLFGRLKAGK